MKETRVPFTAESILAFQAGRKTQTRRPVRRSKAARAVFGGNDMYEGDKWWIGPHPRSGWWAIDDPSGPNEWLRQLHEDDDSEGFLCPYGQPGDMILATETWKLDDIQASDWSVKVRYRADNSISGWIAVRDRMVFWRAFTYWRDHPNTWRSPRYMPKEFVRFRWPLDSLRVERLQGITPEDAIAEGVEFTKWYLPPEDTLDPVRAYAYWWDSINGKTFPWSSNPFVYVLGLGGE